MGVKEMVAAAKSRVRAVTKEELEQELEKGDVQLLDVRDVRERRRGTTSATSW